LLDPKDAKGETNLAGILVTKGLRAEARRRYEHSLLLKSDLQIAHKELADILCGDGEYASAIAHYEEALRIQPDFIDATTPLPMFATSMALAVPRDTWRSSPPQAAALCFTGWTIAGPSMQRKILMLGP
jgi:tetratricopeptide (TPR) repeat protein